MKSSSVHDLKVLSLSHIPGVKIESVEEELVIELGLAVAEELKLPLYVWSITEALKDLRDRKSIPRSQEAIELLKRMEALSEEGIFVLKDFHRELEDRSVLRLFKDLLIRFSKSRSMIILLGTEISLPSDFRTLILPFELEFPSEQERGDILKSVVRSLSAQYKIKVNLEKEDLSLLLSQLKALTRNQVRQLLTQSVIAEGALNEKAIRRVTENKVRLIRDGGLLEYFPVEAEAFRLGGFDLFKDWTERCKLGFSDKAEDYNLQPPKGVMLVGLPGCGKSLSARILSQEWMMPLLKLDSGSLYNKYIGETEKNFKEARKMAEGMSPCILWIDEIEKAFSTETSDGGLSQRLLGSFLSWMQEKPEGVFVLATANQFQKLPPELMRKGRFDEIFYVDLPNADERKEIFEIHLSRKKQDTSKVDIDRLVEKSEHFSGAEIEQAVIAALYECLHQNSQLNTDIIVHELDRTQSLFRSRREDLEAMRSDMRVRFRPVSSPAVD